MFSLARRLRCLAKVGSTERFQENPVCPPHPRNCDLLRKGKCPPLLFLSLEMACMYVKERKKERMVSRFMLADRSKSVLKLSTYSS